MLNSKASFSSIYIYGSLEYNTEGKSANFAKMATI